MTSRKPSSDKKGNCALVLSGGGVRGAYEAGVVAGIVDVLGRRPSDLPPFGILAGTSVGAINAAYFAAHAHRGNLAVGDLLRIWTSLELGKHFRLDPLGLFTQQRRSGGRLSLRRKRALRERYLGRSLLDSQPFEQLVRGNIPWDRLHRNIAAGQINALLVAALEVGTGRTILFAEVAPGVHFRPSKDPRRQVRFDTITASHVLASAAIPLLFPARRIGLSYFCDGGLRFNTPIAPAIRAGADRLVVVSLMHRHAHATADQPSVDHTTDYPNLVFLIGKLLDALLLDPVAYDLQVLERFNSLLEVLEQTVTPEEMQRVDAVMVRSRGSAYRRLQTLVFWPSQDIGLLAAQYVRDHADALDLGWLSKWLLERAARSKVGLDADLVSYLLFDGRFTQHLIDLGRRDVHARRDEVREFFGQD